ncbi:protein translocase subunit SecD [Candidatus Giovannonibacteria bacterium]|nr:protein translocase subunit SecD [Candidatus Giovannonibacteria bacterium]
MAKYRLFAIGFLILGLIAGFFASANFLNFTPNFLKLPFRLGLDLQGGTHLVYKADTSQIPPSQSSEAVSGLRDVIERRVNLFGITEPVVQTEKRGSEDRLIVELAGVFDVNRAIQIIGETPFLEFRTLAPGVDFAEIQRKQEAGEQINILEFYAPTPLNGRYLRDAALDFNQNSLEPVVVIRFNDEGSKLFAQITKENVGKPVAIFLDGLPISAPIVREEITQGTAEISGRFTPDEARTLVRRLNSGALPVPISLVSQQTIGPTLGAESLTKMIRAGVYGTLLVAIFLVIFYRLPGIAAVVALGIYTAILLAIFKLFGVTLTAAGIAGVILSIGMAVDANILIFERTREELRLGKTLRAAVEEGFSRAWLSIRDSNVSSLITCAILFWFGTSIVQGFALTLGIGILASMFSAITITRTFLRALELKESTMIRKLFGARA